MFDFGFWELMLVGIVALLVVGPERLPRLAREIGVWVGKAKRFVNSVRSDIEREFKAEELQKILNKQQDEIQELKGMLTETQAQVKSEMEETDSLVKAIEEQLESRPSASGRNREDPEHPASTGSTEHDAKRSSGS